MKIIHIIENGSNQVIEIVAATTAKAIIAYVRHTCWAWDELESAVATGNSCTLTFTDEEVSIKPVQGLADVYSADWRWLG